MNMHETNGFFEEATKYIQFQINKHGSWGRFETVEDVVNSMTTCELLSLISDTIDRREEALVKQQGELK